MYFLTALVLAIVTGLLWFFFRDRKNLHLEILAITYGAAALMWLIDCFAGLIEEGVSISFEPGEELVLDGWISLFTFLAGIFIWIVVSFILNNRQKVVEEQ